MSRLEDRLRDAFRADAETVHADTIPGVPGRRTRTAPGKARSRRTRVLIPLAAAAAVAAIVVGVSVVVPQLSRGSGRVPGAAGPTPRPSIPLHTSRTPSHAGPVPRPVLGQAAPRKVAGSVPSPGAPLYYVTVEPTTNNTTDRLTVRDTATGNVVDQLNSPPGKFFAAIAAPTGDSTFVTAVQPSSGCSSQLYQFKLNGQGLPGPLVPLHIMVPGTYSETGDLAITPDGRTIAYATYLCDGEGELGVIDLATRHVGVWSTSTPPAPAGLSLSANGSLLVYDTLHGARILNTSAPAGSLLERSQVVSRTAGWTTLAGSGDSVYGCAVSPSSVPGPSSGAVTYYTSSLATGGQQVIASWQNLPYPQCWASLDPSGGYLLVQYPVSVPQASDWVRAEVLDIGSGQLTNIQAPAFSGPLDIAW